MHLYTANEWESYFLTAVFPETRRKRVFSQEACMNASWKFTNGLLGFVVLLLVSVGTCFAQSTATLAGSRCAKCEREGAFARH